MRRVKSRFLRAMIDLLYNGETQVEQKESEEFLSIMRHFKVLTSRGKREATLNANSSTEDFVKLALIVCLITLWTTANFT